MSRDFKFQKLTPIDSVDMRAYGEAMDYVFSQSDVRNIAISGIYGAGKSSMLESYKKLRPDKRFIHISLAYFCDEKADKEKEETDSLQQGEEEDTEQDRTLPILEGKIINQLIHQLEAHDIEQTNFRIMRDLDSKKIRQLTFAIVTFIAMVCFLCFKETWERMINGLSSDYLKNIFYFTTTKEVELISGLIALIIFSIAVYQIVRLQKLRNLFRKITFQGNEIEILEEEKNSYFDRYLNEVLYLFKQSKVDGIVFEDIDRYNKNLIFGKLREINYLLNARGGCKDGLPIRFFYLLKDDIFISKDRTKFFDFILPIVPVVSAANSYDMFLEYFEKSNLNGAFDSDFLQRLSLYIDDMRILQNICNEFVIYNERLKADESGLDKNKLLAIIAYKNIFPKDFGELQIGKGYVYALFAEKENLIKSCVKNLNEELMGLKEEMAGMEGELCNDLDELNAIFFSIDGRISVDDKEESYYGSRKEFVKAMLNSGNIKRYSDGYSSIWRRTSIDNERKTMEQNAEYAERKQLLEKKRANGISEIERKIIKQKIKIQEAEQEYLKNLITRDNEKEFFATKFKNVLNEEEGFEEIKRSPYFGLIKFLVREGYIDEMYGDYMTYFYPNSISANDKLFLRGVVEKTPKNFDYALINPALVISRMRVADFREPEALNFDLLRRLLSNTKTYEKELNQILYNVRNTEPVEFISSFLERDFYRVRFVAKLNEYWEKACSWIIYTDGFTMENRRRYIADTLCVSSDEVIAQNNQSKEITTFIENDADFFSTYYLYEEKIEIGLKKLDIKFKTLNLESANTRLALFVYDNNMYQINMELINKFLRYFYNIKDQEILSNRNLSLILSKPEEPLCKYVRENINTYLGEMLSVAEEIADDEDVVAFVMNCEDVAEENKLQYLECLVTVISSISLIEEKELWGLVLQKAKVAKNFENFCEYYFLSGKKMDDELIAYVNSFESRVASGIDKLDEKYGEGAKEKLFWDIVKCDRLEKGIYEKYVCSFGFKISDFELQGLSPEKMEILIRRSIISLNGNTLKKMREYHTESLSQFIVNNIQTYVSLLDEEQFPLSEVEELLKENKGNTKIFSCLMKEANVGIENKKMLLSKQIKLGMNKNETLMYLEQLELSEFLMLMNGKRPKIKVSKANEELLSVLEEKEWLSSYKIDETDPSFFLTFGRKVVFVKGKLEKGMK